jgi:hypothetical protein
MTPCETQREYIPVKEKAKPKTKAKLKKIVQQKAKTMGWQLKASTTVPWKLIATKPFTQDKIEITMLSQGVIKVNVPGRISAANHMSAETFLRLIHEAHGGKMDVHHKHGAAMHVHAMSKAHDHHHA